jgi:hypothetical protein
MFVSLVSYKKTAASMYKFCTDSLVLSASHLREFG